MRLIDADALTKVIANERDRIQDTYGENDEYVRCLNKYALSMVESAHTIDAIPVEWLEDKELDYRTIGDKMFSDAFAVVIGEWQKEQEANA